MQRYLWLYFRLFLARTQALFAFRLNTLVHFFYGPAYMLVMYIVQQLAYGIAPQLGGWTRNEATLVLSIYFLLYTISFILYIVGLRSFLWDGVRHGVLDQYLTKPISPLFFIAWSKPDIAQLPLLAMSVGLVIRQLFLLQDVVTSSGVFFAILTSMLGICIHYLAVSTYATLGFYMTRAEQILELFDKTSDNGQYATNIFPSSIQMILLTIVPVGFFGYVPALFIFGEWPWHFVQLEVALLVVFSLLHHVAWKYGLRNYNSVSS